MQPDDERAQRLVRAANRSSCSSSILGIGVAAKDGKTTHPRPRADAMCWNGIDGNGQPEPANDRLRRYRAFFLLARRGFGAVSNSMRTCRIEG
jgi:hypothetical protein